MAEYLAGIAARLTGGPPAVRPRVPSLFEPVAGPAGIAEGLDVVPAAAPPAVEPPAPAAPPAPAPQRAGEQPARGVEPARRAEPARPAPQRPSAEPPRRRAPAAARPAQERPRPAEDAPAVAPRATARRPAAPTATTTTAAPPPAPAGVSPPVDPGERLRALAAAVIGEERGADLATAAPEALPPAVTAGAGAIAAPRSAPPASRRGAPPPTAAPTLVRVSIGRVDVRAPAQAAAPAAPAARPARRDGPPALHDYLGRRNGTTR